MEDHSVAVISLTPIHCGWCGVSHGVWLGEASRLYEVEWGKGSALSASPACSPFLS